MLAVTVTGIVGCAGEDLDAAQAAEVEAEPLRLGRVHVVLEPDSELPADEYDDDESDALEVTARFAFVRGLEEDFVRARVDMPVLPTDVVTPQSCVASDQLSTVDVLEAPGEETRELHLVDAGDLRLQIGDEAAVEVPVSLVPDLLPYMTGFEYLYYGDELSAELSSEGTTPVVVEARGSQTEELPPFRAEGLMPMPLALHVTEADLAELTRGALVLHWRGEDEGDDELLTLRLTGLQGGEPVGADITCVVSDVGQVRLAFESLQTLGLMLDVDALRVTASRLQATQFDAGEFMGSELFVERRERVVLPLR